MDKPQRLLRKRNRRALDDDDSEDLGYKTQIDSKRRAKASEEEAMTAG